jgi:hypothetical protein
LGVCFFFTARAALQGGQDAMKKTTGNRKTRARKSVHGGRRKFRKGKLEPLQIRQDAAGIDVGATELFVAVPPGKDAESVRSFPTFTRDLHDLANWLEKSEVRTVAM